VEGTPLSETPARLRGLPTQEALGAVYPVAVTRSARLLGLALLHLDRAGPGLLIPDCRSVHTFGMRFRLDVYFLGDDGRPVWASYGVPPFRVLRRRDARAVLEVPSRRGAPCRTRAGGDR
jgi:uncharacterized membrane protein (UPF0127 family)